MSKICAKCKESKPLTEYYRNSARNDGLASQCKKCATVSINASKAKKPELYFRPRKKPSEPLTEKRCGRCGEVKPIEAFVIANAKKGKRGSYCKPCHNKWAREYRRRTPKRIVEHVEPSETKQCCECKHTKPIGEFHKDAGKKDGYSIRCKWCAVTRAREYYAKNREYHHAYQRNHRASNPDKYKRLKRDYDSRFPERVRANNMVNREVLIGRIPHVATLECQTCGKQAGHYHHPDYTKPLEITPLCESCHRRAHGLQMPEADSYSE